MPFNMQEPGLPGRLDEPELIAKRAAREAQMKKLFTKIYTDPYRHATGQGGFPFDPAHQRYYAMKCAQRDFFKPNFYTAKLYAFIVIIPILSCGLIIKNLRKKHDRRCGVAELSVHDRHPKY